MVVIVPAFSSCQPCYKQVLSGTNLPITQK
jgi:hypothetical protein